MESANKYYDFIKTQEGYEVRYKSNHELMAFFSTEEKDGFVAKNYIDSVKYKMFKRWIKGLETHRDIQVVESDFVYS